MWAPKILSSGAHMAPRKFHEVASLADIILDIQIFYRYHKSGQPLMVRNHFNMQQQCYGTVSQKNLEKLAILVILNHSSHIGMGGL